MKRPKPPNFRGIATARARERREMFLVLVNLVAGRMDADSDYHEAVLHARDLGASETMADLVAKELGRRP
jgi:hypothetical protein